LQAVLEKGEEVNRPFEAKRPGVPRGLPIPAYPQLVYVNPADRTDYMTQVHDPNAATPDKLLRFIPTDGCLYYLGTDGDTRPYDNPARLGLCKCSWSSFSWSADPNRFIEHAHPPGSLGYWPSYDAFHRSFYTTGGFTEDDEWMMVDLGASRRLSCTKYCIRHGSPMSKCKSFV
jgi:hypothetical protein